jgi:hypothetical protein
VKELSGLKSRTTRKGPRERLSSSRPRAAGSA